MASLFGLGTGSVNFFGRYAYVGSTAGKVFMPSFGPSPTNRRQSLASHLHKIAYPDNYRKHLERGSILSEAYEHQGARYLTDDRPAR